MSYTNKTPNLELPQWVGSDEIKRVDFNEAFSKIDAEMFYGITTLALTTNWTNQSSTTYGNLRAAVISPRAVLINGVINSDVANDTSVIATLPVGYRPPIRIYTNILRLSAPEIPTTLRIDPDGTLRIYLPNFNAGAVLCIQNVTILKA